MTADLNKQVISISPTVLTVSEFGADKKKAFEEGKAVLHRVYHEIRRGH